MFVVRSVKFTAITLRETCLSKLTCSLGTLVFLFLLLLLLLPLPLNLSLGLKVRRLFVGRWKTNLRLPEVYLQGFTDA